MERQMIGVNFDSMDNLDFTLTANAIQASLPTEEISARVRYDYLTSESFYEIDVADLNMTMYPDQSFKDLLDDFRSIYTLNSTVDEISQLLTENPGEYHSTESRDVANSIQSTDEQLAMIKSTDPSLPVSRPHMEKLRTKTLNDHSISLSQSVAVTVPTPNQLQLASPLEDTYRARYKSDYFPQNGTVRRPRYVADNCGNHFITLQMPIECNHGFESKYIRAALITTSINDRGHFYSPYKFQINHNDVGVPDQNPTYISVPPQQGKDHIMKLHLVLIKSKLDQLNDAQPLKPFSDTIGAIRNIINEEKLPPKDLITKYQLDKSHIAFTLCTKLPNGTYEVHPETTIISTVITEAPSKPPKQSKKVPEPVVTNTGKKVTCPKCAHCFDPIDVDITTGVNKRKKPTSTTRTTSKSTINGRVNKKKKTV